MEKNLQLNMNISVTLGNKHPCLKILFKNDNGTTTTKGVEAKATLFRELSEPLIHNADILAKNTVITGRCQEEIYTAIMDKENMLSFINNCDKEQEKIPILYKNDIMTNDWAEKLERPKDDDSFFDENSLSSAPEIILSNKLYRAVEESDGAILIQLNNSELTPDVLSQLENIINKLPETRIYIGIVNETLNRYSIYLERTHNSKETQNPTLLSLIFKYNMAYFRIDPEDNIGYYLQLFKQIAAEEGVTIDEKTWFHSTIDMIVDTQPMPCEFMRNFMKWTKQRSGIINSDTVNLFYKYFPKKEK